MHLRLDCELIIYDITMSKRHWQPFKALAMSSSLHALCYLSSAKDRLLGRCEPLYQKTFVELWPVFKRMAQGHY